MAYSASSSFGNIANPIPQLAGPFNKFSIHTTPKYSIGFKVEQADGTTYRYGHFAAAVNPGVLVAQDLSESSVVDTDNVVIAPASAVAVAGDNTQVGAIGSRYVELTLASIGVNQYAGGKLVITDDTGEGYTYDIIGNTATDNPATGNIRLTLAQKLQVALTTTSDIAITGHLLSNLEIATAATDCIVPGVSCASMTAGSWGWVMTKGVAGILQDGTIAVGDQVSLSDGVNGAVQVLGGGGTAAADILAEQYVGTCVDAGDDTGHGTFKVNFE